MSSINPVYPMSNNVSSTIPFDYKTLVGTWKLTGWVMHFIDEGTTEPYFGPNPQGYITFDTNQRMMVIITQSNRPSYNLATITKEQEANLFETMLSYSGKVVSVSYTHLRAHETN
jgi:hypothetical protein